MYVYVWTARTDHSINQSTFHYELRWLREIIQALFQVHPRLHATSLANTPIHIRHCSLAASVIRRLPSAAHTVPLAFHVQPSL